MDVKILKIERFAVDHMRITAEILVTAPDLGFGGGGSTYPAQHLHQLTEGVRTSGAAGLPVGRALRLNAASSPPDSSSSSPVSTSSSSRDDDPTYVPSDDEEDKDKGDEEDDDDDKKDPTYKPGKKNV